MWFLVPKCNHEMQGSWILGTVFSVKPRNGSKSFQKSTFWALFHEILMFFPIETAFSSVQLHAKWISYNKLWFLSRKCLYSDWEKEVITKNASQFLEKWWKKNFEKKMKFFFFFFFLKILKWWEIHEISAWN